VRQEESQTEREIDKWANGQTGKGNGSQTSGVRQNESQTRGELDKRANGKRANGQTGKRVNEMRVRQGEGQTNGGSDKGRVRQKKS
jgi:hypothetical protein